MKAGADGREVHTGRPSTITCIECGDLVVVKKFGPIPRYCSPACGRAYRRARRTPSTRPAVSLLPQPVRPALPVPIDRTLPAGAPEPDFSLSERVELAPHLPQEALPERRRPSTSGKVGFREQGAVGLAVDAMAFAVIATIVLIAILLWFGPAGFIGWLLVAVPMLWFALIDRHMRARYR